MFYNHPVYIFGEIFECTQPRTRKSEVYQNVHGQRLNLQNRLQYK